MCLFDIGTILYLILSSLAIFYGNFGNSLQPTGWWHTELITCYATKKGLNSFKSESLIVCIQNLILNSVWIKFKLDTTYIYMFLETNKQKKFLEASKLTKNSLLTKNCLCEIVFVFFLRHDSKFDDRNARKNVIDESRF